MKTFARFSWRHFSIELSMLSHFRLERCCDIGLWLFLSTKPYVGANGSRYQNKQNLSHVGLDYDEPVKFVARRFRLWRASKICRTSVYIMTSQQNWVANRFTLWRVANRWKLWRDKKNFRVALYNMEVTNFVALRFTLWRANKIGLKIGVHYEPKKICRNSVYVMTSQQIFPPSPYK